MALVCERGEGSSAESRGYEENRLGNTGCLGCRRFKRKDAPGCISRGNPGLEGKRDQNET